MFFSEIIWQEPCLRYIWIKASEPKQEYYGSFDYKKALHKMQGFFQISSEILYTGKILTGTGVNLDLVVLLNEQRNHNLRARLNDSRLGGSL